jgi:hypothetical protein
MGYVGNPYFDYNQHEDNGGDYYFTIGYNVFSLYGMWLCTRTAGTYAIKIERLTAEPIDQQSYLMGFRVGQLLQGMRGRVISGETDITEAILEDGVLYIINAKAAQDDDILEVT